MGQKSSNSFCFWISSIVLRQLSCFTGMGGRLFVWGPGFFEVVKGGRPFLVGQRGIRIFPCWQRGTRIFLCRQRGVGPEKIGDRPSQTNFPPVGGSLIKIWFYPGSHCHSKKRMTFSVSWALYPY